MKAVILILNSHRDKLKNFLLLCKLVLISIFRDIKERLKLYVNSRLIASYSSFNTSSCAVTPYRSLEKHDIFGVFSVSRLRNMNFLAYENRGDSERLKFWNGSHIKTRTGILQIVEVVSITD